MNTEVEQKRRQRRYNLCLPVRVRSKRGEESAVEAVTRDVSGNGLYFTLSEGMEIESELDLEMTLPPQLTGWKNTRIRCRGKIVRVEQRPGNGPLGVAATIEEYEFIHLKPSWVSRLARWGRGALVRTATGIDVA